jgi:regulator of sirC expression with transglutaminase-like and TPR domain
MNAVASERLSRLIRSPEPEWSLVEAALLLAQAEYPALDVDAYLQRIDALAHAAYARLAPDADLEQRIVTLNDFLFEEQGFAGNTDNYYDPRNSFLNEVLDRKLGIPITLSILYLEIGQRLGLPFEGVSFPGHFLVKFPTEEGDVVLDPFAGGVPLTEEDLMDRLEETIGEHASPSPTALPEYLATAGKKDILLRMLRNLKMVYLRRQETSQALSALNRILLLAPDLAEEVRERAELYEKLECFRAAVIDFRHYLRLDPRSADLVAIRHRLITLEQQASRLN